MPDHQQFFDYTIRITDGMMLAVVVFGLKVGMGLRDAVRDLATATHQIVSDVDDHEQRLRDIEGKPLRRHGDRH